VTRVPFLITSETFNFITSVITLNHDSDFVAKI
jgi:hypothetical protein